MLLYSPFLQILFLQDQPINWQRIYLINRYCIEKEWYMYSNTYLHISFINTNLINWQTGNLYCVQIYNAAVSQMLLDSLFCRLPSNHIKDKRHLWSNTDYLPQLQRKVPETVDSTFAYWRLSLITSTHSQGDCGTIQ